MNKLYLFLLLIGIIKSVGSIESSLAAAADSSLAVKYHGSIRYWTSVNLNGKTYISLNVLKEAVSGPVKLLFPKAKNIGQILSDLTLFSPTNNEDACKKDTTKLEFKLIFDNENWIRGEVIVELKKLIGFLYGKCPGVDGTRSYATNPIDVNEANFEAPGRTCFTSTNPFRSSADSRNVMELQVTSTFKCQVFLILPAYMDVEDEVLPEDAREPMNATFAEQGEAFWWKDNNNASLSDGISFDDRDVVIDITKSNKSIPYFLRIGKDQPYPSLNFKFDASCSGQQYDLFVNLRGGDDCKIKLALTQNGIKIMAKDGGTTEIADSTKSPTMVFARGEPKVYIKAGTSLSIASLDVCQIENSPDVPVDQFVLQIAPSEGSSICNRAQVILPAGDVQNKLEVLLDRIKAAKLVPQAHSPANETSKVAKASFEWWWWIIIGGIIFIIVAVIIIATIYFCVRHRRMQNEKKKAQPAPKPKINNDQKVEKVLPTPIPKQHETVIPVEESAPRKYKTIKKNKKDKKKKETTTEQETGESKNNTKPTTIEEQKFQYEEELLQQYQPKNARLPIPKKRAKDLPVQPTQDDSILEIRSTQKSSKPTVPGTIHTQNTQKSSLE